MATARLRDLTVEEASIEDVVRRIYQEGTGGEPSTMPADGSAHDSLVC